MQQRPYTNLSPKNSLMAGGDPTRILGVDLEQLLPKAAVGTKEVRQIVSEFKRYHVR